METQARQLLLHHRQRRASFKLTEPGESYEAVKRAFNWAIDMGITTSNPITRLKKPSYEPCEEYLTQEQFDELILKVKDDRFKDYLNFLWFTGCRPQEIQLIEAKHILGEMVVLTKKDSKGKKYNRTIYLNDDAIEIVKRLSVRKSGPLFRNSQGKRWTSNAIRLRFRRLDVDGLCARMLRHS